jgi:hypothetical protein
MKFLNQGRVTWLSLGLSLLAGLAQAESAVAGYVTQMRGEVRVVKDSQLKTLLLGHALHLGSRVSTGADARLEARMKDGSVLTLGERTDFDIDQVAGATPESKGSSFSLLKGVFRAVTGQPAGTSAPSSWQVRTPVAIIGVRGTTLWGGLNLLDSGADTLDVVMLEGKGVYVENSSGTTDLAKAGEGTTVKGAGAAPGKIVPWGEKKLVAAQDTVRW